MIISKPDEGSGLLYHVIDLDGQTVHAYRDAITAVTSLEGDQRLAIYDERFAQWRVQPARAHSTRKPFMGALGSGARKEKQITEATAKRLAEPMFGMLANEGDAIVIGRAFSYNQTHALMIVLHNGKYYLACPSLDLDHWERYFGVRVS
jgi:hypothetical protein